MIALAFLLIMPVVVAQPVFENGEDVTLSVPCSIDGSACSITATCDATIINPDGVVLYNDVSMIQNGAVFEINLTGDDTQINGEYQFNVACVQGGRSSSKILIFFITPNGEVPTTAKGILYGGLLFVLVIFFILAIRGGSVSEGVIGKSAFYLLGYLLLIGITFISWNLSLDYMTSAPFLASFFRLIFWFLMVALVPIILILTFYTLWMMSKIDAIQNMINKGMPVDEAYERTVKSGLKNVRNW